MRRRPTLPLYQGRSAPLTLGAAFQSVSMRRDVKLHFFTDQDTIETVTYGQLFREALKVAGALRGAGLEPGERVAIVLPTCPDFYRAFFGVILAGGVPAALYPPVRLGRIDEWKQRTTAMLEAASAVGVLTERRLMGLMGGPVQGAAPRLGCRTIDSLRKEGLSCEPVERHPDDLAAVQFSSGSTGAPKPVALSHFNMISNAWAILQTFPGRIEEHSGVSWLPLYHDMGLIGGLLVAMVGEGDLTLISPERFVARPRLWLEALTWSRATVSVAPNFAFGLCTSRISADDLAGLDLSQWQLAICGAEPVHPNTMNEFMAHFGAVGFRRNTLLPVYGLAEASLAVTFSAVDEPPRLTRFDAEALELGGEAIEAPDGRSLVALGSPIQGVQVAIRDDERRDLPDGRVGTIWVAGDGIMTGYLDQPEATAQVLLDGWLDTGDLGVIYGGDLYVCGRRKDLIIIRGRNYDPALIEQALDGVDGFRVGCAAAFGVADPEIGTEGVVLLAELREGVDATEVVHGAGVGAVRAATTLSPDPLVLLPPGALPRTSSGKIRRSEAKARFLAGTLDPPGSGGAVTLLMETAKGWAQQLRARLDRRD